jgi:pyridoxamine 5'-phosphate oxidase
MKNFIQTPLCATVIARYRRKIRKISRNVQGSRILCQGDAARGPAGRRGAAPKIAVMDRALTPEMLDSSPMKQFAHWFDEAMAAGLPEPNAMVLTTIGDVPHARTVLLKAHDADGFTFYTNRTSRKGRDLAADPRCCALFPWYGLGRQVTVEGAVRPLTMEESEPYYHSRPWLSQISAWASHQSAVLGSRDELDDRVAELSARWPEGTPVPMPDFWGGYLIVPDRIEFWQSRPNRLHDRLSCRRSADGWAVERLSP